MRRYIANTATPSSVARVHIGGQHRNRSGSRVGSAIFHSAFHWQLESQLCQLRLLRVGATLLALVLVRHIDLAAEGDLLAGEPPQNANADADNASADQKAGKDSQPKHTDPKMVEIIKHVRENELRYFDLETIVRRTTQVADAKDRKKWSPITTDELWHTVQQDDLIYFRGETSRTGDIVRTQQSSAFDGEKTRSIEYGNSVNIHLGRKESPDVYPPHNWALVRLRINFPLSVFLEGTDAIRSHPKVVKFPHESGSIYEFPRVETSIIGEDTVDGLACVKIRCKRYYSSRSPPVSHLLWLARERNYLCVKSETVNEGTQEVSESTRVEAFRELAPNVWILSKVVSVDGAFGPPGNDEPVGRSKETLTVKKAIINPRHPVDYFRNVTIPADLPLYRIEKGRLAGSHFEDRTPTADAPQKLRELLDALRRCEQQCASFEVELEKTYYKFGEGWSGPNGVEIMQSKTLQRSISLAKSSWYSEQAKSENADGNSSGWERIEAYDGSWLRSSYADNQTLRGVPTSRLQAIIRKNGAKGVPAHHFHMLFFHDSGNFGPLAEFLVSGWDDEQNGYRLTVSYLGDETRDGLRCAVLRLETIVGDTPKPQRSFRLVWLARDKSYLPVRYEWHEPAKCPGLPTSVGVAKDIRELRPGVWCPFQTEFLAFNGSSCADLCTGRMIINYRTIYALRKATLDPQVAPDQFAGPTIPKGTTVYVETEAGQSIGQFLQASEGRPSIAEPAFSQMLKQFEENKEKKRR